MQLRNEQGRFNWVNLTNLGLRILQIIFGATVLGLYASQYNYNTWKVFSFYHKFSLGTAAGALALATAPFLAVIPFFLGYVVVAWAFIWDFIVMCVHAGTFAYFNFKFSPYDHASDYRKAYSHSAGVSEDRVSMMQAAVSVVLVGMILWLITLLMSISLLIFGKIRGSSKIAYKAVI